ncbi:hypothetical protein C8R44DRAFT_767429 [Mycena epipterygia]|nr:hypothetical protein C8R44DRAFT_767429 [Mycena epipterygia]
MHDLRLPLELIFRVLDLLEPIDLLVLRQANKIFHKLATGLAFQRLTVTDTVHSAQGLLGLQESPSIVNCVTSLVFRSSTLNSVFPESPNDLTKDDVKLSSIALPFTGLSKFPQLASLSFEFHDMYSEEYWTTDDPSYFFNIQSAILNAASSVPLPALKSLTLVNLIAMPDDLYETQAFADLLRPLESLTIEVLGPDDLSEGIFASDPLREFWAQMTPILSAAQSAVSLQLSSNAKIGVIPELTFPSSALPQLKSLLLDHIFFDSEDSAGGAESFVLLHADHLTALVLKNCPLYGYKKVYERPWATVLANMGERMHRLESLSLDRQDLNYAYEDEGWGFTTLDADEVGVDGTEDLRALERLVSKVEARG